MGNEKRKVCVYSTKEKTKGGKIALGVPAGKEKGRKRHKGSDELVYPQVRG